MVEVKNWMKNKKVLEGEYSEMPNRSPLTDSSTFMSEMSEIYLHAREKHLIDFLFNDAFVEDRVTQTPQAFSRAIEFRKR